MEQHNRLRHIHEAPPMTLSDSMNEAAEEYAQELFELGRLRHCDSCEGEGENLAYGCSTAAEGRTVQDAVKAW